MPKIILKSQKRTLSGRKVKQLRRQQIVPGNVFGKKVKSLMVQVDSAIFQKIYLEAGETGLVDLVVDTDPARPVLITNVQIHPVTGEPTHVDFHQVDLTEKVTAHIPVEIIGESPAVKDKSGILVTALAEIEVEALPADLPDKFEVDISVIKEIGESITIASIKTNPKVEIKTDPEEVIVLVQAQKVEVEEVAPTPAEAETTVQAKPDETKKEEGGGEAKKE